MALFFIITLSIVLLIALIVDNINIMREGFAYGTMTGICLVVFNPLIWVVLGICTFALNYFQIINIMPQIMMLTVKYPQEIQIFYGVSTIIWFANIWIAINFVAEYVTRSLCLVMIYLGLVGLFYGP